MYDVAIQFKDTGKTEMWYLDKSDLVFMAEATLNEGKIPAELDRIKSLVSAAEKAFRDNKDEAGWLLIQAIENSANSMEMSRLVAQAKAKM